MSKRKAGKQKSSSSGKRSKTRPSTKKRAKLVMSNIRTEGALGIELKYFDTVAMSQANPLDPATRSQFVELFDQALGSPPVSMYKNPGDSTNITSPTWTLCHVLNSPTQGSGATQRIGRQITVHSTAVEVQVSVLPTGSYPLVTAADGTLSFQDNRVPVTRHVIAALVLDMQNNGDDTGPEIRDVFAPSAKQIMGLGAWKNLENSKRFRILDIKRVPVHITFSAAFVPTAAPPTVSGVYSGNTERFFLNSKKQFTTSFQGNNGSATDIVDRALRLYIFADTPLANTGGSTDNYATIVATASARIRFVG